MTPVLDGLDHHVSPCAHGPGIQRQIALGHARLLIEPVSFPRHRSSERHGQPIAELRILAIDTNSERVIIQRLYTVKGVVAQIQPRRLVLTGCRIGACMCKTSAGAGKT